MAGLIPQPLLEQIRAANDIVEVVGSYFPLKRMGANFLALCPFHKEKTPSFNVNPHRQIFHCFGCHKGGNVFTFVQEYENLPFLDAVRKLAERARIPLTFDAQPGQEQARHLKEQLRIIHEQITQRWHTCLLNEAAGQAGRDYLTKRQVPQEAVTLFRLGFAPDAWDDTVNWGRSKGFDIEVLEKAGLVIAKEDRSHYYDRFRGRLIFPIGDEQSRVIGFSGRILAEDAKAAKYVNSPETLLFQKSKVFFGLDKSRRAMADAGYAIVCEGQLDLIACYLAGVQNVVAPQGTAFTADHARILKRYVDEVLLCFDADAAGQNAAIRALDPLLGADLAVRVAVIPAPHDPDSFIREHGVSAFRQHLGQARGFFDFYLDRLCQDHDPASDKGRIQIVKAMAEAVHKTLNEVLIDTYTRKTAHRLGVSSEAIRTEFRKHGRSQPAAARTEAPLAPAEPPSPPPSTTELWLLKILVLNEDLVTWAAPRLDQDWINHPTVRSLVHALLQAHQDQLWQGLPGFIQSLEDTHARSLVTEIAAARRAIPNPEATLKGDTTRKGLLEVLRNEFVDRRLLDLQQEANRSELSAEDIHRIEMAKAQLRQLKRLPLDSPQQVP